MGTEPPPELLAEPDPSGEGMDPSRVAGIDDLRHHTARGTILNSAYQVGLSGLGLLQRLVAAAFLSASEFGLWAVVLTIVVNMSWLKDLGIPDKYIQQTESNQEEAFQRAFTLELLASLAFFLLFVLVLPLWALAYGHEEIIVAGLVTALAIPMQALQMPAFIPYRRLQYGRQRLLTGVMPIVTFVFTVSLAVAGFGYWSFVLGAVTGSIAGAIVCIVTCPYRIRLRFDRATAREYATFSWPLAAAGLSRLVLVQGSLLIANWTVGLGGVGAIGIVIGIVAFTDRIDSIISQTIYPVVCAVADRLSTLEEVFVKSNRAALMWAVPFGVGLALFAGDLITYVLGEKWRSAEDLLIVTGLSAGIGHLGFNWIIFLRALNWTRPILVGSVLSLVVFLGVALPAMNAWGLAGYAAAFAASTAGQLGIRAYYMGRVFPGFGALRHASRSLLPAVPPTVLILALRLVEPETRTLLLAISELALYVLATAICTLGFERRLVKELLGYLRRRRPTVGEPAAATTT